MTAPSPPSTMKATPNATIHPPIATEMSVAKSSPPTKFLNKTHHPCNNPNKIIQTRINCEVTIVVRRRQIAKSQQLMTTMMCTLRTMAEEINSNSVCKTPNSRPNLLIKTRRLRTRRELFLRQMTKMNKILTISLAIKGTLCCKNQIKQLKFGNLNCLATE